MTAASAGPDRRGLRGRTRNLPFRECHPGVSPLSLGVTPAAMEPQEVRQSRREERELLEWPVAAVATLGELVATVTAPHRSTWPLLYPESLHQDLREFIWNLRDTLDHGDVTSLGQRGVTPLGQALATPGAIWADVRAAATAWRKLVHELFTKWNDLVNDAIYLLDDLLDKDTTRATEEDTDEETAEDTASAQDGDLMDDSAGWGTSGDNLVATAQQTPTARAEDEFELTMEEHFAQVDAAKEAKEEAMVAVSRAVTVTRRDQQVAVVLLGCLVADCKKASWLFVELHDQITSIEAALEGTQEAFPDVPEALVAMVAKFERLWEASARLTTRHLLVTLGEIDFLLLSPYGGSGGPRGPRGRAVAKRCQRAIEDIPRLLKGK